MRWISNNSRWEIWGILLIALLSGCGEGIGNRDASVSIPVSLSPALAGASSSLRYPALIQVTITDQDNDSVVIDETVDVTPDEFAEGEKILWFEDIPVEVDLLIEVSIYDEADALMYQGSDTIYISLGETGDVWIDMAYIE